MDLLTFFLLQELLRRRSVPDPANTSPPFGIRPFFPTLPGGNLGGMFGDEGGIHTPLEPEFRRFRPPLQLQRGPLGSAPTGRVGIPATRDATPI